MPFSLYRLHHIIAMRMAAVHSSLAAFDSASEDWTEYVERLQFYFNANDISEAAKQ